MLWRVSDVGTASSTPSPSKRFNILPYEPRSGSNPVSRSSTSWRLNARSCRVRPAALRPPADLIEIGVDRIARLEAGEKEGRVS